MNVSVNELRELLNHMESLFKISKYAEEFRSIGLRKDEIIHLFDMVIDAIAHSTGRDDLPIIATLNWLKNMLEATNLPDLVSLEELKRILPPDPLYPSVRSIREVMGILGLEIAPPPPPTPSELLDEFDALLEGFSSELRRHISTLKVMFDSIGVESIPYVIELVSKNPDYLRTTLGEALGVWWTARVLGSTNRMWSNAKGPVRVNKVELDAVSVYGSYVSVAEVKNASLSSEEFSKSPDQIAENIVRADILSPSALRTLGFKLQGIIKLGEVAIITLHILDDNQKEEIKSKLKNSLEQLNLTAKSVEIYDGQDILNKVRAWPYKGKDRYIKMFDAILRIFSSTE